MRCYKFVTLIFGSIILNGCSSYFQSTHPVLYDPGSLDRINQTLQHRTGRIFLKNGDNFLGNNFFIRHDSTFWNDEVKSHNISLPNTQVEQIVLVDHLRGGVDGLTIGVGTGLTIFVGGVIASPLFDKSGYSGYAFFYAGLASIPIGWIIGSAVGHSSYFTFPVESNEIDLKSNNVWAPISPTN